MLTTGTPEIRTKASAEGLPEAAIRLAAELAERYGIPPLHPLIESSRKFAREDALNVAVLGRFKAGKSSFLNHVLGRDLLPVGVIPVTSVVTEIRYGPVERAQAEYVDGRVEDLAVDAIGDYIDEARNPDNRKGVALVKVELPSLERFRGIRFVDTPGLESVLSHNTDTSRDWLPNVGLAILAVGVDSPLSQRDLELIRELSRYTPDISLLLTKVDVIDERGRAQVQEYVQTQLNRYWNASVPVFPYSIRPGYESLRETFEKALLQQAVARSAEQRQAILAKKTETLLRECGEYLAVALKSAEAADSERDLLKRKILGDRQSLDDSKLALRLVVRHATANTRALYEKLLEKRERELNERLLREFTPRFSDWTQSFSKAAASFEDWLEPAVTSEIARLSMEHRPDFLEPLHRTSRQLSQCLQDFRNRISERTMQALGVPLPTTGVEIEPQDPRSPDIRIGKIFDHEWELISFLIPMTLVKRIVERHFRGNIAGVVFKNLSRLASQWEQTVNAALSQMEKEAVRRLDGLVAAIERLLASVGQQAPGIREDLAEVERVRDLLAPRLHRRPAADPAPSTLISSSLASGEIGKARNFATVSSTGYSADSSRSSPSSQIA